MSTLTHTLRIVFSLLIVSNAIDLSEFNYTEFVDNIRKEAANHKQIAALSDKSPLLEALNGAPLKIDNGNGSEVAQVWAVAGKEGDHALTYNGTHVEIDSKGHW